MIHTALAVGCRRHSFKEGTSPEMGVPPEVGLGSTKLRFRVPPVLSNPFFAIPYFGLPSFCFWSSAGLLSFSGLLPVFYPFPVFSPFLVFCPFLVFLRSSFNFIFLLFYKVGWSSIGLGGVSRLLVLEFHLGTCH